MRATALTFAGLLLAAPIALLAGTPGSAAHMTTLFTANPMSAAQLAVLTSLALAALICGISQLSKPSLQRRIVRLDANWAAVEETVGGRRRRWREPLQSYSGIRHRIVTTSEGAVHTLMLEHPQPSRSLHIACETHIANQAILDASQRYGLPILGHQKQEAKGRATGVSVWIDWLGRMTGIRSQVPTASG